MMQNGNSGISLKLDLYFGHRIQQPIPKLRIFNFHEFLTNQKLVFFVATFSSKRSDWLKKLTKLMISSFGIGCWI
jgi:hypothetical protein